MWCHIQSNSNQKLKGKLSTCRRFANPSTFVKSPMNMSLKCSTQESSKRSDSPFSSPLFLVRKHNADLSKPPATWYRQASAQLQAHQWINPGSSLSNETLCKTWLMRSHKNPSSRYSISPKDSLTKSCMTPEGVTAFSVPGMGHFKYVRSAMGVVSSPAMFQKMMEKGAWSRQSSVPISRWHYHCLRFIQRPPATPAPNTHGTQKAQCQVEPKKSHNLAKRKWLILDMNCLTRPSNQVCAMSKKS